MEYTVVFNNTTFNNSTCIASSNVMSNLVFVLYRCLGVIIILTNFFVVISSGLILKKGQKPRSTYMLLGNVSLADMIIGVTILIRNFTFAKVTDGLSPYCILVIGAISGPKMVSILSVGLIALDRYIFIIHGLYYRKWVTTLRIRIVILCTWIIGTILAFLPLVGWLNPNRINDKCDYLNMYPKPLKLAINITCLLPLFIMPAVYLLILGTALRNIQTLKTLKPSKANTQNSNSKQSVKENIFNDSTNTNFTTELNVNNLNEVASSSQNLSKNNQNYQSTDSVYSNFSVVTETSSIEEEDTKKRNVKKNKMNQPKMSRNVSYNKKAKTKTQAIIVILLTSGTFIVTWGPLHIAQLFYMYSEDKEQCNQIKMIIIGPLAYVGFLNCIFNPIIYAWWHKGFSNFIKSYYTNICIKLWNK